MSVSVDSLLWLTLVGFLWGGTNPFLKKGATGMDKVEGNNIIARLWKEVYLLLLNWKYMIPFLLNQSGSVVYFLTLQNTEMSVAVPIANSLTFVFTAISGWFLSEGIPNAKTFIGIALVLSGISLCVFEKSSYTA
ncbi:transmembrane protein 234 homolog [Frankliniella occidentalis]|uniref:Transmembrane protein 234 homolog n=1 Tax=Frankliniella occidentalis TaxID=133901 RepID=A0A6J1SYJ0_FRAOC|nr:transmembrane protein 234 homolog [Frankliniella occidentalis]